MQKVVVCKGSDGYNSTKKSLMGLHIDTGKLKNKKILIKPNAGRLVDKDLGINTSPDVVAGVIDFFKEAGVHGLTVGESPIMGVKALNSLKQCGISQVALERGVKLLDLDSAPPVVVKIENGKVIDRLKVCRGAVDADYIVSVPVIKTHMHTQVSLGLKNMKGCLYKKEKVKLHQLPFSDKIIPPAKSLDAAVADMSNILLPNLTVIDGTIAQEGLGPSAGAPVPMGVIIASENCLAADWVAVRLMGFDPVKVHHLQLAIESLKRRSDSFDIDNDSLVVEPADYMKWKVDLKSPPKKISLEFLNVKVEDKDSCSACLSTVLMFLQRHYKDFADYFSEENPLHIAIGKGIGKQPENALLIGNCTFNQKGGNIFVKGCPPVASEIKAALFKKIKK